MTAHATQGKSDNPQKAGISDMTLGIDGSDRRELAKGLTDALAETYVIYAKTQALHWNIVGPMFYSVHKLTDEQYNNLAAAVDALAERLRAIGFPTPTSLTQLVARSKVKEWTDIPAAPEAIAALVADHEEISRTFRKSVKMADEVDDVVTADMLTERMQHHETMAWMLRSLIGR